MILVHGVKLLTVTWLHFQWSFLVSHISDWECVGYESCGNYLSYLAIPTACVSGRVRMCVLERWVGQGRL